MPSEPLQIMQGLTIGLLSVNLDAANEAIDAYNKRIAAAGSTQHLLDTSRLSRLRPQPLSAEELSEALFETAVAIDWHNALSELVDCKELCVDDSLLAGAYAYYNINSESASPTHRGIL